jgi:hypothetical protein
MSLREQTAFSKRFHRQLDEIHANIETLPEAQRPYFRSLAEQAEQHHRSMEGDCAKVRDIVDDLRLTEASVKFDIWAAAENMKRLFASHNPQ